MSVTTSVMMSSMASVAFACLTAYASAATFSEAHLSSSFAKVRLNTWESAANIEDASLIDEWDLGKRVVADVKQAIYDISE